MKKFAINLEQNRERFWRQIKDYPTEKKFKEANNKNVKSYAKNKSLH
jgi:hypothetical protein